MFGVNLISSLCLVAPVLAQDYSYDYVTECPEDNGYFADALQCDRYYECQLGEVSEHLCPDGLVFDEASTAFAKCSFPFSVDCTGRPELQPAQSSKFCPRLNGYFADPDPAVCDVFYFCVDGVPNRVECPSGLIFDPTKGQCGWTDQTDRKGCRSQDLFEFQCPNQDLNNVDHSRHPDPEDCTQFFLCIGGKPRKSGCGPGLVYNEESTSCERQDTLEDFHPCRNFFNQTYLDEILPPVPKRKLPSREQVDRRRPALDTSIRRRPQGQTSSRVPAQVAQPVNREPDFSNLPPQLQDLAANSDLGFVGKDRDRVSFLNSLQTRIANKPITTTTSQPFTRPSRRPIGRRPQTASGRRPPSVAAEIEDDDTTGSRFAGNSGSRFSGNTGSRFSGNTGSRFSGNTGSRFSGNTGSRVSENTDSRFSGNTGSRFSGNTGSRFSDNSASRFSSSEISSPSFTSGSRNEIAPEEEKIEDRAPSTGFGRRRVPQSRVPPRVVAQREEQTSSVAAARRPTSSRLDISNLDNLGPSDLDAFLTRQTDQQFNAVTEQVQREPPTTEASSAFGLRRRVPVSRGGAPRSSRPSQEQSQDVEDIVDSRVNSFRRGGIPRRSEVRTSSSSDVTGPSAAAETGSRRQITGSRRPAGGSGRIAGSGLRRRVRPRTEASDAGQSSVADQSADISPVSSRRTAGSSTRGRLEVTRLNALPPLKRFEEEDIEFGSFSNFQQSRGRQG